MIGSRSEASSKETEVVKESRSSFQKELGSEVLIGLDAIALYPSIMKKVAVEACKQAAIETEVGITHMNLCEATKLLVLVWSKEQQKESEISKYLLVRRVIPGKRNGKLGLTTTISLGGVPNDKSQWVWPNVRISK